MKRIISLVLAACLIITMFCSLSMTVFAGTTITDITVDLSKVYRVGTDTTGLTMSYTNSEDGSMNIAFSNYAKLFMEGDSIKSGLLWLNGAILALKDNNDNYIVMQKGTKYSINVIYDVTSVGTSDTAYVPQIGIGYNNHSTNCEIDNGTFMLAANKHNATGSYSLSAQTTPTSNQPLRMYFGGHGAITVRTVTIKTVTHSFDEAKTVDLTNVEPISVSNPSYSNFKPATDTTPLSLDVNAAYAYNGTLFDGTNTWINEWTVMNLKSMIPLKYDVDNYVILDSAKSYYITVKYKVTATAATKLEDYPEIGIVRNNGYNLTQDNGSKVIAAQRIAPADVGTEKMLITTIDASTLDGYPLRLAFTGKGSFEISSITIAEYSNAVAVTFVNDGITTVDYVAAGSELPTPVKSGYTFMGWFNSNGVKTTAVSGSETLTAAWLKNGNVDLTKSVKIDGTKANMTVTAPTDNDTPLNVTVQGFQNILMNETTGEMLTNSWTGGAAISLKYHDDSYVNINSDSKYIVNVNYDVAYVGTENKTYYPQIAIIYNNNTSANNVLSDNGTVIMNVKKHSETVTDASISCIISGVNANAVRLAFDGQGIFDIKSVTVSEMPAGTFGLSVAHYTDSIYNIDKREVAVNGSAVISDLPRTLLYNFGGWYNGEEIVTTVTSDISLTAKWFDRADVTMNGSIDVLDIIRVKKALADKSSDLLYDISRDNEISAADAIVLRKILLGINDYGDINMNLEKSGYKLVWSDEFDGNKLDGAKWTLRADMSGYSDLTLCGEENPEVMRVEDGKLKLNVIENVSDGNEKSYSTCYSVTTFNKMRFRYGYLEIYARVPYMQGAWPSFWLKSLQDDICPPPKADYMAEIDVFEVFSNTSTAVPNLHKWYPYDIKLDSGYETNHTQGGDMLDRSLTKQPYVFKDITNLSNEYHTYGFEWTPEYISMSVDGEVYCTYDINSNFDGYSDMSGFHDTFYVLFNNHIFTENSTWSPDDAQVDERTDFPIHYWIDYIRLYQKDEYGDLYLA